MNKMMKSLLAAALAVSASGLQAHTNKTHLSTRPQGVNLPLSYTSFNDLVHRKAEDSFGGHFQVTGFYQASTSGKKAGRYFAPNNKNVFSVGYSSDDGKAPSTPFDLDLRYLEHIAVLNGYGTGYPTAVTAALPVGNVTIDPRQTAYGATFQYYQDLEKLLKGLYLSVNLPVVHVENDLRVRLNLASGAPSAEATAFVQYFNGTLPNSGDLNAQVGLSKAKIAGKQSATGVADIDIKLGYNFLDKESYHVGLNLGLTIPTSNENKGNFAWEPLYGNGDHWAFGGGLDALIRVWGDVDHNVKVTLAADYRYLFENSEVRTVGLNLSRIGAPAGTLGWGQYYLLGDNKAAANAGLVPAANVTTLSCDVTPGSQFDGIAAVAYNNGGFTWDVGYNLYWREAEKVSIKGKIDENRYGVAARTFNATNGNTKADNGTTDVTPTASSPIFGGDSAQFASFGVAPRAKVATDASLYIKNSDLAASSAANPSQLSHKVYTGLGYAFKEWDTPLMLGLGGSYEWADNNSALDQWAVWLKAGVAF